MTKIKFVDVPNNEKANIFNNISAQSGLPPFAVEKDWWVVQILATIFEMEVSKHLVFKGGTSLSKAWNIIERFSEDIDLAIERDFFGFTGVLGKNQRDKLRKTAGQYIDNDFFTDLKTLFEAKGFANINLVLEEETESDKDRKINLYYPNVIEPPDYLQARVQIEISCRSLREPFTMKTFESLVDEFYSDKDFAQLPINVPTVNPERTFLEKIFLLHEEFHRPLDKMRVDKLSRHLYDVVKLSKTEFAEKALSEPELYKTIVEHRYTFTRIGGVNYNLHQPQTINPIPIPEVIQAWKTDYNTMIEHMIYEVNPPSFDQTIEDLNSLKDRINALPWQLNFDFPNPNL